MSLCFPQMPWERTPRSFSDVGSNLSRYRADKRVVASACGAWGRPTAMLARRGCLPGTSRAL